VFALIRRDIALRHGEFRDTPTIEPCTVVGYWVTPFIQDPPADPSCVKATIEEGQMILCWEPNLAPFFYSYELYVMRDSEPPELLSAAPSRVAGWVDTTPPHGMRTYGVRAVSASGTLSAIVPSYPNLIE